MGLLGSCDGVHRDRRSVGGGQRQWGVGDRVLAPAALPLMRGETGLLVALVRRTSKHVAHPATSASPSDKLGA